MRFKKCYLLSMLAMLATMLVAGQVFAGYDYPQPDFGQNSTKVRGLLDNNFGNADFYLFDTSGGEFKYVLNSTLTASQFDDGNFTSSDYEAIIFDTNATEPISYSAASVPNIVDFVANETVGDDMAHDSVWVVLNSNSSCASGNFTNSTWGNLGENWDGFADKFVYFANNTAAAGLNSTAGNATHYNASLTDTAGNTYYSSGNMNLAKGGFVNGSGYVSSAKLLSTNGTWANILVSLDTSGGSYAKHVNAAKVKFENAAVKAVKMVGNDKILVVVDDGAIGSDAQKDGASISLTFEDAALKGIYDEDSVETEVTVSDDSAPYFTGARYYDRNFDGYVDRIYLDASEALNASTTIPTSMFTIAYNGIGTGNNTVASGNFTSVGVNSANASQLVFAISDDAEILTNATIALQINETADLTPIQDANGNVYNPVQQMGVDVTTFQVMYLNDGAATTADILANNGAVEDFAGPAPQTAVFDGDDTITVTFSEDLVGGFGAANEAGKYFVVLDEGGYLMDVTNWDVAAGTNANEIELDAAGADMDASLAKTLYVSQENATDSGSGLNGTNNNNLVGRDYFNYYTGQTPEETVGNNANDPLQTWNKYREIGGTVVQGTQVSITSDPAPKMDTAVALWKDNYYKYILVQCNHAIKEMNSGAANASALENRFGITVSTGAGNQTIEPVSVLVQNDNELLMEVPHTRQWSYNAGVRPLRVTYNATDDIATDGYIAGKTGDVEDEQLQEAKIIITNLADDRQADVRAVEVHGKIENFGGTTAGGQVIAFEAYKYAEISEEIVLDIDFEYGPLARQTSGAFGISSRYADTDQCEQEGVYTGIYIDTANGVGLGFITDVDDLKTMIDNGVGYIHTDEDADNVLGLTLNSTVAESQNHAAVGNPGDSVFKVEFVTRNDRITVRGDYGVRGSGEISKSTAYNWAMYDGSDNLSLVNGTTRATPAGANEVGKSVIPLDSNASEYKIVARDELGVYQNELAVAVNDGTATNEQKEIASRILDKKVLLVLEDIDGKRYLLNGITDDVDISYNFYDVDGAIEFNPDFDELFSYDVNVAAANNWYLLPNVTDKTYSLSGGGNVVTVGSVNEAIIGLTDTDNTAVPVIMGNDDMLFGLDTAGLAFAQAKSVRDMKSGYAYAVQNDGTIDTLFMFGYGFNNQGTGMGDYEPLDENVMNFDSNQARDNRNLGWNLMANVEDMDLTAKDQIDYAISFDLSTAVGQTVFKSWIKGVDDGIQDFSSLVKTYAPASELEDDDYLYNGFGKGYFLHTGTR